MLRRKVPGADLLSHTPSLCDCHTPACDPQNMGSGQTFTCPLPPPGVLLLGGVIGWLGIPGAAHKSRWDQVGQNHRGIDELPHMKLYGRNQADSCSLSLSRTQRNCSQDHWMCASGLWLHQEDQACWTLNSLVIHSCWIWLAMGWYTADWLRGCIGLGQLGQLGPGQGQIRVRYTERGESL